MEVEKIITEKIGDISIVPVEIKEKLVKFVESVETEKSTLSENLTKIQSDMEFQKAEAKKAFLARDEAKKEVQMIRDKTGGQTYQDLYDNATKKIEELSSTTENLKKEKEAVVSQLDKIKEDSRNALIERLPKESEARKLAETFDFKTDSGMNQLKSLVDLFKDGKFEPESGRSGEFQIDPKKTWWDYTAKELDIIAEKNPDHFKKLKSGMHK